MPAPHKSVTQRFAIFGKTASFCCCIVALLSIVACATVEPAEREHLAKPSMTFGAEPTVDAHEDHLFNNREGSFGGRSVNGGGCGCN